MTPERIAEARTIVNAWSILSDYRGLASGYLAEALDEIERLRRLATADVVAFLMGERELDGCWFSERPSDALGAFWWRSHLAELRAAVLDGGAR